MYMSIKGTCYDWFMLRVAFFRTTVMHRSSGLTVVIKVMINELNNVAV